MVTLADLRARRTLPNWQEAVAIVQELFEATVEDRRGAWRLPDVGHIGLNADGTIALLPHSSLPEHPVRHLAVLLSLLLEGVPAPEPLLAIAERNLKAPPEFATPDEFTRSLRYFERPGRDDDIKALVARAEDAREEKPVLEELGHLERRALELLQTGEIPERHVLEPDGSVSIFTRDRTASLPGMSGSPVTTTVDMPGTADARPVRRRDLFGALRLLVVVAAVGAAVYWFVGPEIIERSAIGAGSARGGRARTAQRAYRGSAAAPSAASGSPGSAADRRPFSARRSPTRRRDRRARRLASPAAALRVRPLRPWRPPQRAGAAWDRVPFHRLRRRDRQQKQTVLVRRTHHRMRQCPRPTACTRPAIRTCCRRCSSDGNRRRRRRARLPPLTNWWSIRPVTSSRSGSPPALRTCAKACCART